MKCNMLQKKKGTTVPYILYGFITFLFDCTDFVKPSFHFDLTVNKISEGSNVKTQSCCNVENPFHCRQYSPAVHSLIVSTEHECVMYLDVNE
jgi:hypothetical protein